MQQDGARLAKLKEVFKKAIQEILKEEPSIIDLVTLNETKDSFYSNSSMQLRQDEIRMLFAEIKHRFSEVLKEKIRQNQIDIKLNGIDKDIMENRTRCRDLNDDGYLEEIFESYVVDKKEYQVKKLEEICEGSVKRSKQLELEIEELESKLVEIKRENREYERIYLKLVDEMEQFS